MSLCRAVNPAMTSSSTFLRLAATCSSTSSSCSASLPLRTFSSYRRLRVSSKRELQTSTSYRPHTLPGSFPPPPPAPRNSGVPDTSITGGRPEVSETRPLRLTGEHRAAMEGKEDTVSTASPPEKEAQKSKPVSQTTETSTEPTTITTTAAASTTSTSTSSQPSTRPKRKLRPRKAAMSLTPTAIIQLRSLLSQPEPKMIRVGVKNRGCSGLAYHLEYVDKPGMFDEVVEQEGVKVLIDSKALFSIIGSEMDWHEDPLSQRFVFRNPNIKEECGCGESFMV